MHTAESLGIKFDSDYLDDLKKSSLCLLLTFPDVLGILFTYMRNSHKYIYSFFVALTLLLFSLPEITVAKDISYSYIIMDIRGDLSVVRNGQMRKVGLGELLYPGDVIELAKDDSLTINYLESGQQEHWPGSMKAVVGTVQSEHIPSGVLIVNEKVVLPEIQSPQKGSFTLRGVSRLGEVNLNNKIEVAGLSNTAILEQQPTFNWKLLNGTDIYTVTLYLEPDGKLLWQRTTTEGRLSYPQSEEPLTFGAHYKWKVAGLKNGTVIVKRRSYFYLPEEKDIADVRAGIAHFQEELSRNSQATSAHLAYIFFLENCRLYDAALTQYEIFCATHNQSDAIRQRREKLLQIRYSDRHY